MFIKTKPKSLHILQQVSHLPSLDLNTCKRSLSIPSSIFRNLWIVTPRPMGTSAGMTSGSVESR